MDDLIRGMFFRHFQYMDDADPPSDSSTSSHDDDGDDDGRYWLDYMRGIQENDPDVTHVIGRGSDAEIRDMRNEDWEGLGRDISNNTNLEVITLCDSALNDLKMSFLFRELTRSSSITEICLHQNQLTAAGVQSMVPFLQNSNNLKELDLNHNNLHSEGFNILFRGLRNSPIEKLSCACCGIESFNIDIEHIPHNLKALTLRRNDISADGCRGLATLLRGEDSTLDNLFLADNKIDDEGVEILVDALQNNTSLMALDLDENRISNSGKIMLLKLVNDISSIEATLQSNHTLCYVAVDLQGNLSYQAPAIRLLILRHISLATDITRMHGNNVAKEKVIQTQLNSEVREIMADLQGVHHSVYNDIDPLHLPEVLSLIDERHGPDELYTALSSSIAALFSIVNRKKCIQQQMESHTAIIAEHTAILDELGAELGAIEATEGCAGNDGSEHRSNKRRRKWWWGLWGEA